MNNLTKQIQSICPNNGEVYTMSEGEAKRVLDLVLDMAVEAIDSVHVIRTMISHTPELIEKGETIKAVKQVFNDKG